MMPGERQGATTWEPPCEPARVPVSQEPRHAPIADARLFGRHQIAAFLGTTADFAMMILLVELASFSPPLATVASAMTGGVVNFSLSRAWAFHRRHAGTLPSQAARYAAVSLGGALLNATLLAAALHGASIPYPGLRALVAVVVSVLYTYPLHTRFVFRVRESA